MNRFPSIRNAPSSPVQEKGDSASWKPDVAAESWKRVKARPFLFIVLGIATVVKVLAGSHLQFGWEDPLVPHTIALVAVVVIVLAATQVLREIHPEKRIGRVVFVGGCFFIAYQIENITDLFGFLDNVPFLGYGGFLHDLSEKFLLVIGIVLILAGLYLSLVELRCTYERAEARVRDLAHEVEIRNLVEEKLKESEKMYRQAIEVAGAVPYFQIYAPDSYSFVGGGIRELLGCEPEQFNDYWDNSVKEVVLLGDLEGLSFEEAAAKCRTEGLTWRADYRIRTLSGEERWVANSAVQVYDEDRSIVGSLGILQDITEKKKKDEALRKSEAKYRDILENIEEGYFEVDLRGRFTFFNDSMCHLLGYSPEEMKGMDNRHYTSPETARKMYSVFNNMYRTGESSRVHHYEVIRKDGTKRILEISASLLRSRSGKPIGFRGIARDRTERRLAEQNLRYRLEFEDLIMSISTRFIDLEIEKIDEAINEALVKIGRFAGVDRSYVFQYSDDGRIMDNTHEWCADGIEPQMERIKGVPVSAYPYFQEVIAKRDVFHIPSVRDLPPQARVEREEFDRQDIRSLVCVPMIYAGEIIGFIGFDSVREEKEWSDDVISLLRMVANIFANALSRKKAEEERRSLEEQFLHAQKMESLGLLAGGIAHDFNNLLMAVLGNASLALSSLPADSEAFECIRQIEKAGQRAAELTNQMLAYSGHGRFLTELVQVSNLVREMIQLLEISISKKIQIVSLLESDLPAIRADRSQIRQIVMNLIINAAEAIGDRAGTIRVETKLQKCDDLFLRKIHLGDRLPAGDYVCLDISDTGCGMNPDTLKKIFDPFFTTKFTGRGLGLSAVLGIIRSHNGGILVKSAEGEGTTFQVYFPAAPVQEPAQETEREGNLERRWSGEGCILVVDDEAIVRDIAKRMLERCGFKVLVAENGEAGVELFRLHSDSLTAVLLDMTMPVMDGAEAFEAMRKINPRVPVILSSGYGEQEAMEKFSEDGVAGFVQKPYQYETLVAKVEDVLRNADNE